MSISRQKKVGIIIIAILLLGVVALVQTGKLHIPGLKSDALDQNTNTPTITNVSFNQSKGGDPIDFTVIGSGFSKVNDVIITEPDGNEVIFSMGIFDDGSDGSSIHVAGPSVFMKEGEYTLQVKNSDSTRSNTFRFHVNQGVPVIITNSCPQLTPPAPDFCKDGTIVDGGVDDLGCSLPVTCAPKASLTANGSSDLSLPLGTALSYTWSSGNAVSASSTYTTNKASCSSDNATSGKWLANTLQGSLVSPTLTAKYIGCSYVITYTVKDKDGKATDSVLKLNIVDPPAPTAVLKVNGSTGGVTVHVREKIKYEWSSDNAAVASSTYTTNKASCGAGGTWLINKPNGVLTSPPLPSSYSGCVFTLNFKTTQASTGKTATSTVVMTVQ